MHHALLQRHSLDHRSRRVVDRQVAATGEDGAGVLRAGDQRRRAGGDPAGDRGPHGGRTMRREVRLALTVMDDLDLVNGDSLARCKGRVDIRYR